MEVSSNTLLNSPSLSFDNSDIQKVTINASPAIPMLVVLVGSNSLSTKDTGEAPSTVIKFKSAVATLNTAKRLVRTHNLTHVS